MKLTTYVLLLAAFLCGCGNAGMKEINPDGGTATLYAADGSVIAKYMTDGKPEMNQGGHLFLKQKGTGKLVIIYGTYTFVED